MSICELKPVGSVVWPLYRLNERGNHRVITPSDTLDKQFYTTCNTSFRLCSVPMSLTCFIDRLAVNTLYSSACLYISSFSFFFFLFSFLHHKLCEVEECDMTPIPRDVCRVLFLCGAACSCNRQQTGMAWLALLQSTSI